MQTFLPYSDFTQSLMALDTKRHGKQRVEAFQLLRALGNSTDVDLSDVDLTKPAKGWVNHPAAKMWRGYEAALALYHDVSILTWIEKGYNNAMRLRSVVHAESVVMPPWMGDADLHASHRSNLLRKDPIHYGEFLWEEGPDLPYIWPVA